MITLQYIFLHVLLVILLYYCCLVLDKQQQKKYWLYTVLPILLFTIEEGLRWGRGLDWNLYYYDYSNYLMGYTSDHEILFRLLWSLFAKLTLSYSCVISFSSFLLIYSIFFFSKPYQGQLRYIIPFVVVLCSLSAENLIRWYMAISLFLIALRFIFDKHWKLGVSFLIGTVLIHSAMLVAVAMLPFLLFSLERVKPIYFILFSLLLIYVFDVHFLERFVFISKVLTIFSDRFQGYDETWLSGESQTADFYRLSWIKYSFTMIPSYVILYSSWYFCIRCEVDKSIYRLLVLAILIKSVTPGLQLLIRYYHVLEPFIAMIGGMILYRYRINQSTMSTLDKVLFVVCVGYFIKRCIDFCSPLEFEEIMGYTWNDVRDPLKLQFYYYK